jgi:muramoyltetrapeptide carboxypeptidase
MSDRFDHLAIAAADFDKSLGFYRDVLRWRVIDEWAGPRRGARRRASPAAASASSFRSATPRASSPTPVSAPAPRHPRHRRALHEMPGRRALMREPRADAVGHALVRREGSRMATSSPLKSSTRARLSALRIPRRLPEPRRSASARFRAAWTIRSSTTPWATRGARPLGGDRAGNPRGLALLRGHRRPARGGLHALLDDDSIDLVIAARGGYGPLAGPLEIDWNRVAASTKQFVGFSDFTAFNMAAYACAKLVTFHGPMLTADFASGEPNTFAQQHFWMALSRTSHRVDDIHCDHGYEPRRIDGHALGRQPSLLAHLIGTPILPQIDDGLLYVEEIKEEPYAIERMFLQLYHAGVLGRQRAILLGDFTDCTPRTPHAIPMPWMRSWTRCGKCSPCPVLTGLPFGHVARKVTLPFGAEGTLSLGGAGYSLRFAGHVR